MIICIYTAWGCFNKTSKVSLSNAIKGKLVPMELMFISPTEEVFLPLSVFLFVSRIKPVDKLPPCTKMKPKYPGYGRRHFMLFSPYKKRVK